MKKIMFSHGFGLHQSVLDGSKTMTRRICREQNWSKSDVSAFNRRGLTLNKPEYMIGEVVAIAQSYKSIYDELEEKYGNAKANEWWCSLYDYVSSQFGPAATSGYKNKMFVKADLMPHQICITGIKVERLWDISDEDCLREGIVPCVYPIYEGVKLIEEKHCYTLAAWQDEIEDVWAPNNPSVWMADKPKTAFNVLFWKLAGKKVWESNPWVYAYSFELMK